MSLGVHFGIDETTARRLRKARNDTVLAERVEAIEEGDVEDRAFETDKAWDALRHCFTVRPLELVFFGGEILNKGEDQWVVMLTPAQVREAAAALANVDRLALRARYDAISPADYQDQSDDDFEYTWSTFQGLPEYFGRMADAGLHVIFTVG